MHGSHQRVAKRKVVRWRGRGEGIARSLQPNQGAQWPTGRHPGRWRRSAGVRTGKRVNAGGYPQGPAYKSDVIPRYTGQRVIERSSG